MTVLIWLAAIVGGLFALYHLTRFINRANILYYTSSVRRCSSADDRLFRDLVYGIGGVKFADQLAYPEVKKRRVTSIQIIRPSNGQSEGLERWTIAHESDSCDYLVSLLPDGAGGTVFSVQKEG